MSNVQFREQLVELTGQIANRSLDQALQDWLNQKHGVDSDTYRELQASCRQGIDEGWLCQHEAGGIRFGRAFKPDDELHRFSVDVVDMDNVVGPHHAHPNGEIDLIMPIEGEARFDDHPAGWVVYPPGSAHKPTITDGRAYVLYLLPEGSIAFTR